MFAQGLHASEIAKPTGVHPAKLGVYRKRVKDIRSQCALSSGPSSVSNKLYIHRGHTRCIRQQPLVQCFGHSKACQRTDIKVGAVLRVVARQFTYKCPVFSPESKHIGTLGITSIIEHVYGFPSKSFSSGL